METIFCWSKFIEEDRLEEWEALLSLDGVTYVLDKPVKRKRWRFSSYATSQVGAEDLRLIYGGTVTVLRPEDWQPRADEDGGLPIRIRESLLVTGAQKAETLARLQNEYPQRTILSFPPQLAFGTGEHPTTAGCLRFLADFAKQRSGRTWRVLDLGCGSGILAIAAAKLGAAEVIAVENDGMALEYARQNAVRHGVSSEIEFIEADAVELMGQAREKPYDLIAANLFSDLLVALFPLFPPHLTEEGEVIVSGFLATQAGLVSESAAGAGLPLRDFLRRGKWMAARSCIQNGVSQTASAVI